MIQMQTNLDVADNSGARRVQCIKVLGGSGRKVASVGDVIVVSIKEAIPRGRVKKGDVHRAVIVRTASEIKRPDGSVIRFDRNAAVLINNSQAGPGGIEKREAPLHISNVAHVDPESGKPTRIGYEIKDGVKTRVARASGKAIG